MKLLDTESSIISLCEDSGSGAEHGNRFNPSSNIVYINFGLYTFGIKNTRQCGVGDGVVVPKTSDVADALFHELCHAFHWNSGALTERNIRKKSVIFSIYGLHQPKELWKIDEEVLTICGRMDAGFDPISCNMYDICKYAATPDSIIQRVFHYDWKSFLIERSTRLREDRKYLSKKMETAKCTKEKKEITVLWNLENTLLNSFNLPKKHSTKCLSLINKFIYISWVFAIRSTWNDCLAILLS